MLGAWETPWKQKNKIKFLSPQPERKINWPSSLYVEPVCHSFSSGLMESMRSGCPN
jgi:hypothetical protein